MKRQEIEELISQLGTNVSFANETRNYCTYDEERTNKILKLKEKALPYIDSVLKRTNIEEEILDCLQILDKMLDDKVQGIEKLYPTLSRFNDTNSANIQVMLSGIYRKTLVPDAFGPLAKMLIRQSISPNYKYFDPTEEIGGALYEYIRHKN